jgi:hypothetical protein
LVASVGRSRHRQRCRSLVVYCSHDPEACELAARSFQRETGIETAINRKPTDEFYAQIRAEAAAFVKRRWIPAFAGMTMSRMRMSRVFATLSGVE